MGGGGVGEIILGSLMCQRGYIFCDALDVVLRIHRGEHAALLADLRQHAFHLTSVLAGTVHGLMAKPSGLGDHQNLFRRGLHLSRGVQEHQSAQGGQQDSFHDFHEIYIGLLLGVDNSSGNIDVVKVSRLELQSNLMAG